MKSSFAAAVVLSSKRLLMRRAGARAASDKDFLDGAGGRGRRQSVPAPLKRLRRQAAHASAARGRTDHWHWAWDDWCPGSAPACAGSARALLVERKRAACVRCSEGPRTRCWWGVWGSERTMIRTRLLLLLGLCPPQGPCVWLITRGEKF